MVCKINFCSKFLDISDKTGRKAKRRRRIQAIAKPYAFHANTISFPLIFIFLLLRVSELFQPSKKLSRRITF